MLAESETADPLGPLDSYIQSLCIVVYRITVNLCIKKRPDALQFQRRLNKLLDPVGKEMLWGGQGPKCYDPIQVALPSSLCNMLQVSSRISSSLEMVQYVAFTIFLSIVTSNAT